MTTDEIRDGLEVKLREVGKEQHRLATLVPRIVSALRLARLGEDAEVLEAILKRDGIELLTHHQPERSSPTP